MATVETTETANENRPQTLTAFDRCDSCGAQAYMRVTMASGGELLFCAHHGNKNRDKINAPGTVWYDESYRLSGGQG
jgi:hypothetical protein